MAKAYKFDDFEPRRGSEVSAFTSLSALKDFVRSQGGSSKYWEISGTIVKDEGGPDGITIRVESARRIHI